MNSLINDLILQVWTFEEISFKTILYQQNTKLLVKFLKNLSLSIRLKILNLVDIQLQLQ